MFRRLLRLRGLRPGGVRLSGPEQQAAKAEAQATAPVQAQVFRPVLLASQEPDRPSSLCAQASPAPWPVKPLPPLPEVPPSAYELVRLNRKEEIKAKFLELFGEHMTKNSYRRVDWSRVLGWAGLPDGSDDE